MPHHRSLLHGVSGRHLIEIRHGNLILFSLSQEFIDRHAGSELEIRRKLAVHIILEMVIRRQIVIRKVVFFRVRLRCRIGIRLRIRLWIWLRVRFLYNRTIVQIIVWETAPCT